jgi:hypothetical protein
LLSVVLFLLNHDQISNFRQSSPGCLAQNQDV